MNVTRVENNSKLLFGPRHSSSAYRVATVRVQNQKQKQFQNQNPFAALEAEIHERLVDWLINSKANPKIQRLVAEGALTRELVVLELIRLDEKKFKVDVKLNPREEAENELAATIMATAINCLLDEAAKLEDLDQLSLEATTGGLRRKDRYQFSAVTRDGKFLAALASQESAEITAVLGDNANQTIYQILKQNPNRNPREQLLAVLTHAPLQPNTRTLTAEILVSWNVI